MQFTNTLTVNHPIDDVWSALIDVERVTPCVPGAEIVGHEDDDAYDLGLKVKVGPVAMRYRGQVQLVEADAAARHARLEGRLREVRGQGSVKADIDMTATGDTARTMMELRTDVTLTGKVASLGQGMLGDVAASVLDAFARNLEAMLRRSQAQAQPPTTATSDAAPPGAPPPARSSQPAPSAHPAEVGQAAVAVGVARRVAARGIVPAVAGIGLAAMLVMALRTVRGWRS
jgi:carbon monoxide dehydrogenase subunit G